jgi:hypothetical protein
VIDQPAVVMFSLDKGTCAYRGAIPAHAVRLDDDKQERYQEWLSEEARPTLQPLTHSRSRSERATPTTKRMMSIAPV